LIVLIAALSGVRRAELFALKWSDIDFEKNVIRIRRALFFRYGKHQMRRKDEPAYTFVAPKSEASVRDIPLSPALKRELLGRYMAL
jgi:integrase